MNDTSRFAKKRAYGRQNLLIAAAHLAGCLGLIVAVQRAPGWPWQVLLVLVFCLAMQGVFSLMHDCIHGNGHPDPRLNYGIGVLEGLLFGTAYTLFQVNHEGHHVRNRSRAEIAEYIFPDEHALRKIALYYFAILGGIWLGSFAASLLLPFVPYRYAASLNRPAKSMNGYSISFTEFSAREWQLLRLEGVMLVAFWAGAIWLLDLRWQVVLVMYSAFAFSWSSLQWIYHMRTPLDRVEGAYDLRSPWPVRWLFLNFNYNLSHHRHPDANWQQLPALVDGRETQPIWYRYLKVFQCPEPLPADTSLIRKVYF